MLNFTTAHEKAATGHGGEMVAADGDRAISPTARHLTMCE